MTRIDIFKGGVWGCDDDSRSCQKQYPTPTQDLTQYRKKTELYIKAHLDHFTIQKLKRTSPLPRVIWIPWKSFWYFLMRKMSWSCAVGSERNGPTLTWSISLRSRFSAADSAATTSCPSRIRDLITLGGQVALKLHFKPVCKRHICSFIALIALPLILRMYK